MSDRWKWTWKGWSEVGANLHSLRLPSSMRFPIWAVASYQTADPIAALSDQGHEVVTFTSRAAISKRPCCAGTGIHKFPCAIQRPTCRRDHRETWAHYDGPHRAGEKAALHFTPRTHQQGTMPFGGSYKRRVFVVTFAAIFPHAYRGSASIGSTIRLCWSERVRPFNNSG
jgi:hypothetical protein